LSARQFLAKQFAEASYVRGREGTPWYRPKLCAGCSQQEDRWSISKEHEVLPGGVPRSFAQSNRDALIGKDDVAFEVETVQMTVQGLHPDAGRGPCASKGNDSQKHSMMGGVAEQVVPCPAKPARYHKDNDRGATVKDSDQRLDEPIGNKGMQEEGSFPKFGFCQKEAQVEGDGGLVERTGLRLLGPSLGILGRSAEATK
jgi:hypothetical protein